LTGFDIESFERIYRGRNSKVYRLSCSDNNQYVLKSYFRHPSDSRDRLGVEFSSLQFIWENGIRCIPKPIIYEKEQGYAIYEYIDGAKIPSEEITESDINSAAEFLGRLKGLKTCEGSRKFSVASEACFSINGIVANVQHRMERLLVPQSNELQNKELNNFLLDQFIPLFDDIKNWCNSKLEKIGLSYDVAIADDEKTLSPSDFGFHNALRRKDGRIVFLDFEYFGWDDPAKMISDFLLHPAMDLGEDLKLHFVESILRCFEENPNLGRRVETVYPLFGLKWCLILLNEFLPDQMLRRGFAMGTNSQVDLLGKQLSKAKMMLNKISNEYKEKIWENY